MERYPPPPPPKYANGLLRAAFQMLQPHPEALFISLPVVAVIFEFNLSVSFWSPPKQKRLDA